MHPISLTAWAVCALAGTLILAPLGHATTTPSPPPSVSNILKQINRVNDDGSYTIGYEAADGTFKIETRDGAGHVKGMFGYIDPSSGQVKRVAYTTNTNATLTDELPVTVADAPSTGTTRKPSSLIRPYSSRSRTIKLRPEQDSPALDDELPLAMLLRRSRQGSRSDADELLRLQNQNDAGDVYGNSGPSYQVPDIPFRSHFLQGGRGRLNNAVLQHHLRQLTPDQLYELQQYASSAQSVPLPDPMYVPRSAYPTRSSSQHPILSYLSRDVLDTHHTRPMYPYPTPTYPTSAYPTAAYPTPASAYPYTSARSYPYQAPGVPDEIRQVLIQRMLLAARLLGVEGLLTSPRYSDDYTSTTRNNYIDQYEDPRYYPTPRTTSSYYQQEPRQYYPDARYYSQDPIRQYTQGQYTQDPRYTVDPRYTQDSRYSVDPRYSVDTRYTADPRQYYRSGSLQQPGSYYNALALARAQHARQLAAYQQSLQDQEQQQRQPQYVTTRPSYEVTDDPSILELRRHLGERYPQVVYRVQTSTQQDQSDDQDQQYVTPSSVSSTTQGTTSTSGQRSTSERPTPSYIQRVRSVQVLNPTSAPRGSTTASPTTRRTVVAP